jgi:proteic killer suppression protein
VIRSFADKRTARLLAGDPVRELAPALRRVARRKLLQLQAATTLDQLRVPPGNRLEKLGGDRAGQWSIRVNDQWRICFRWSDGQADDVRFGDYHG